MTVEHEARGAFLDASSRGQPEAIERLLAEGIDHASPSLERFAAAERVWVIGIGTSYHAASVGALILRETGVEAHAVHSFDFVHYPPALRPGDAAVLFSHRGTKRFSINALGGGRQAGLPVILITGEGSGIAEADLILKTVPQERSAAHTISYTTALVRLTQLAIDRAGRRGVRTQLAEALATLPARLRAALALDEQVQGLVERARAARVIHAVGGGPNAVTATEAALKLKEATYTIAEGMAVEQFIHGPIVAVDAQDMALLINVPGAATARMTELAAALSAIGTTVVSFGAFPGTAPAGERFELELGGLPEVLTPLVTILPLQRLAYHLGLARGVNPDSYRRDQPVYDSAIPLVPL